MEAKTTHNTSTLEKIESYIKELKQGMKIIKKDIKDLLKENVDDETHYDKIQLLTDKLDIDKIIVSILKENRKLNTDIINLYIDYNESNNYNNLPDTVQTLIIDGDMDDDNNICNFPLTLKRIFHTSDDDNLNNSDNNLKLPFNCKYVKISPNLNITRLKKNKIDCDNIHEIVFYKDLQLYRGMYFCQGGNGIILKNKKSIYRINGFNKLIR